ncbi:MAG: hypothetical protein LBJ16_00265 [Holosporaceae bacterium]|jgi:hypothetical protein|nr:hypothetical protein [Holosporaceae bacterium]
MNRKTSELHEEPFCLENVMSYSNIEITHVNDNRAPLRTLLLRAAVGAAIVGMLIWLFWTP